MRWTSRVSASRVSLIVLALGLVGLVGFVPLGAGEKSGVEITTTLKGHTELVYAVAFSPDGKHLVTGSFDNTLKLWETGSGKELKTFGGPAGHSKMVVTVAFSNDGQMIASGSSDNTLKVWDVPTSSPLKNLAASDAVTAVALSVEGAKVAVGTKDGQVKAFTAGEFKELFKLEGNHQGAVTGLAFSANGQFLVSSGADKTLRFWNAANGQLVAVVGAHQGPVNGVAINPNNMAAYSIGEDGQLKAWTLPPVGSKPLPAHTGNILAMALSGDGSQIVTGGADKTVRQSLTAGKEVRALADAKGNIASVALNPGNTLVAAGTDDSKLHLWNAGDGKPVTQFLAHGGRVSAVSFHPTAPQVFTGGGDGLIKIWALPPVPPRSLAHPEAVQVAVANADGKKIFTGGADKILRAWDVAKLTVERQFTGHPGPISAVAVSANGQILVSGGSDGSIRFWNQAMGKEAENLLGHAGGVTSLAINPAGTQLLSCAEDGAVKLWQLPVAAPKPFAHPDAVTSLAVTADGAKLVTGSGDKQVRLWNVATAAKEKDFTGPTLAITSVAVSGDGKFLAGGSADKTVHYWSAGDAKVLQKMTLPAVVQAVALSPDSKTIAAGLADNAIKLLNTADGKEGKALAGHKGAVSDLAYTPKGDLLFSASADKTVQSWVMPDGAPKSKFDHVGPVTCLALSKDGARLVAAADKTVKVWNLADGKEILSLATPADIKGVAIAPDNSRLVLAGADKVARIYEISGQLVEAFPHDGPVHAAVFLDAKRIITGSADKLARLLTSSLVWQKNHAGPVRQAMFSPKGDQALSAGDDKVVKIWNAADGKELKALPAHEGALVGFSLSSDGTKLATAAADKTVKVWNLAGKPGEDAKPAATFTLAEPAQSVALSPNGLRVAVGVSDKAGNLIRVFDLALNKEIQTLAEHGAPVKSLAFLADNRTLVTGSADKTARLLDVGVVNVFEAHPGGVVAAQINGAGNQLLTAGADKTVKLWDLAKLAVVKTFGPTADPIKFAVYNRDFTQVGAATGKTAKVWSIADGKELLSMAHPADVLSLSFSVDKAKIATGCADKLTRVFDAAGKELQFFAQDDAVSGVVFHPQNTSVVSAGGKTPRLDALGIARVLAAEPGPIHAVTVVPAGTHVLTGGADKAVKMWNIANGNNERTFAGATGPVRTIAVAKNNIFVAIAGDEGMIRLYNLNDAKEMNSIKAGAPVKSLAFTANNASLVAALADKRMIGYSLNYNANMPLPQDIMQPAQNFTAPEVIADLTIAPDNATIYTGVADKNLSVWKLASPAPTRNFPHPNLVDSVAFQPNGALLASGGHDGKIRIFELVKNTQVREINAHAVANATMIYAVAFTPDGKQIASASADQSVKLWDVGSGQLVREFKAYKAKDFEKGHTEPVYALAFSPDGKFLASGSAGLERVIKIWNVGDGTVARDLQNPNIKTPPDTPVASHPGWVYNLRWTKDGKHLISVGDAPKNHGFLAVWNPMDGKMLLSETLPKGSFYGLALSSDDRTIAIGAGPRGRPTPEFNSAYVVKLPLK